MNYLIYYNSMLKSDYNFIKTHNYTFISNLICVHICIIYSRLLNEPQHVYIHKGKTTHKCVKIIEWNEWADWHTAVKALNALILNFFLKKYILCTLFFAEEEGLIERASHSGIILPGPEWHRWTYNGPTASVIYQVRVMCDQHYYNTTCTKFCRPRNDKFGHYTCDHNGDKVCRTGWMGSNCETGIDLQYHLPPFDLD